MKKSLRQLKLFCLVMLFSFSMQAIYAQTGQVSGTVYDQVGEAIIGASVVLKGTSTGTITDLDGRFTIQNISLNSILEISYMGYNTEEIPLNGRTNITVTLTEATQNLDEFVVVGYGVMRKSDLTGAVSSVKAADAIKNTPTADLTSALQGRLAGVSITSTSGAPGSGSTIRVRGMNSLQGDTGPLIVIDGIPGGSMSALNPSDIASVEVLKDASATAVYGSKGANGVILITTKDSSSNGKVNVTYNGYVNFKSPIHLPDMLSPYDYANLANEFGEEYYASRAEPTKVFYTEEQLQAIQRGEGTYDYLDNIFRDMALEHTHELSISGGTDKTRFLFSGSYNDNDGIAYNSNAKRVNYRLKVDSDIRKWLRVGFNFWGDYSKSHSPRFSQYHNMLIQGLTFPTTIQPRVDGENSDYNNANLLGAQYNPMLFINEVYKDNGYSLNNRLQGYFEIEPIKGLTFRMTHSFVFNNRISRGMSGKYSFSYYQYNNNRTSGSVANTNGMNWINVNTLNYVKEFNENHRLNATVVFEQESSTNFTNNISAIGFLSDKLGPYSIGGVRNLSDITVASNGTKATMMALMGRVNYVFMNRYMITASLRYDGSSRLYYPDYTWEYFPSVALAWNIKEENFMKNVYFMDQFKLRAGYGQTGNQSIPIYSVFDKTQNTVIADGSSATVLLYGNANVWWERNKQYNLGLDLGFLNNRITLNLDLYNKTSEDVFATMNVPMIMGIKSLDGNSATIENKGFEITLGGVPVAERNFNWNSTLTLSKNVGTVKELPDGAEWMDLSGNYENKYYRLFKGEKIASMYGYKNLGVWTTEEVAAGLAPEGFEAGSYKYEDIDGEEGIGPEDKQIIGNGQPTFQWGWNNTLTYNSKFGDFDLSLFVIGVHGFDIYNYTRETRFVDQSTYNLGPNPEWNNRWVAGTNESTDIAGFVKDPKFMTPSSQYVEKGDFIKVKSITLGYSLPKKWIDKVTISNLRVYCSVQNPFLITKYSGIDPEVTLKTPITSGIDWGYYPNGRNVIVGLNLTF